MSIRTLTADLEEEALEAHRRQRYASVGAAPLEPRGRTGQRGAVSGRARTDSGLPVAARPEKGTPNTPPVRQVGIRSRQKEERWEMPGGIVARFGLHADHAPQDREPPPPEPEQAAPAAVKQQPRLHDIILQNQPDARQDENIVENVTLSFHAGKDALPVARLPGWPETLPLSPTAGHYPNPGEQWVCVVDAEGLVYPMKRVD